MRIHFWLAAAAATFVLPQTASAEEAVEAAIREWVAAIDATPEWSARYDALTYDAATDSARVSGLTMTAEKPVAEGLPPGSFTLATLVVTGYVEGPDGYKVRSVSADGGVMQAGFMTIRLSDIALDDFSAPFGLSFAYDPAKPFSSIMQTYAEVLGVGLREGRIGTVELDQTHIGVTSTVVYKDFLITDMAAGKIARFDTGAVRMESPTPDGLVKTTIGGIESRDTDLAAFVHVYDPAAYVNGFGDMQWRDALAYASYRDVVVEVPGARINIGDIVLENFRLRQPPESFVGFFDEVIARPNMPDALTERLAMRALPSMFSSFSVGRFAILDTSVEAMGIDHFALRDFHMNDFSIDGLGEFGFEGLEGVVQGQGAIEMARFAFGGITFGGYEALTEMIAAGTASPPRDVSHLAPKLGFVEIAGIELQTPDIARLSVERFRSDFSDYAGLIPTRITAALKGLSIPVSAITDPSTRDMLRTLGYDRVVAGFGLDAAYDQAAKRLTLADLNYGIEQMGWFSMSGAVSGMPIEALTDEALMQRITPELVLERAKFTFKDDSIVGKGLDLLAGYMNAPAGMFRDQFADAMPFLLSVAVQNDPQLMAIVNQSGLFKQLTPVVRDFVANPGSSITISIDPPAPVAFQAITDAVENTPKEVVPLLGLTITGEKGTLTPPPAETAPPETPGGTSPAVEPGGSDGGATGGSGATPATPKPGGSDGDNAGNGGDGDGDGGDGGSTPASRDGTE